MPLAVGLVVTTLLAIGTIVSRYRRSTGIERLQLRWFAAATATLPLLLFAGNIAASHLATFGTMLFYGGWALGVNGIAVAIGIAVTRYRLYEIDRIISRTVTYGVVTAVLSVIYTVIVALPGAIIGLTSDVLVAVATLASAAMFVPVRRRIQDAVDRRFNRSRYDAAKVVDVFSARLRDSLDIGHLAEDLRATVAATVQPTSVSIWIPNRAK